MTGKQRELYAAAANDLIGGLRHWRIWMRLASNEIRLRYVRSLLGPFWLAITSAIWAFGLGFVFATLWKTDLKTFLPHVTTGVMSWYVVSGILGMAPVVFIMYKSIITSINIPISIQIYRFMAVQVITFLHNVPTILVVLFIYSDSLGWTFLLMIPGLILVVVNGTWLTLALGLLGARFRDLQQVTTNLVNVLFFLTPIVWRRETLGSSTYIADLNPFFHLLEVMRAPMMGEPYPWRSLAVISIMAVIGWAVTFVAYARYRPRIYYWI